MYVITDRLLAYDVSLAAYSINFSSNLGSVVEMSGIVITSSLGILIWTFFIISYTLTLAAPAAGELNRCHIQSSEQSFLVTLPFSWLITFHV